MTRRRHRYKVSPYISGLKKHWGQRLEKSKAVMQLFKGPCQILYSMAELSKKKFKQCTNISFGNLLVVQIYVVHLFSAVGVCTVCVWFFLPFVCLITLFVGAKTKRFTFRLHFVDLLKNIET